jgi:hypothetical protein
LLILLFVLTIIGCVLSYHLGAEVERLKHDAARSDNWRPMPFINELTMRHMSMEPTSATNPAPFDRRRRPICRDVNGTCERNKDQNGGEK